MCVHVIASVCVFAAAVLCVCVANVLRIYIFLLSVDQDPLYLISRLFQPRLLLCVQYVPFFL